MNVKANRIAIALLVWSVLGGFRAYAQPKYSVTELGPMNSSARGINNSGQATGVFPVNNTVHSFRTAPNSPVNLPGDDISSSMSGILQTQPNGINNAGQITGYGTIGGQSHAFLLTPISAPEPGTIALAAIGMAGFGTFAFRRWKFSAVRSDT